MAELQSSQPSCAPLFRWCSRHRRKWVSPTSSSSSSSSWCWVGIPNYRTTDDRSPPIHVHFAPQNIFLISYGLTHSLLPLALWFSDAAANDAVALTMIKLSSTDAVAAAYPTNITILRWTDRRGVCCASGELFSNPKFNPLSPSLFIQIIIIILILCGSNPLLFSLLLFYATLENSPCHDYTLSSPSVGLLTGKFPF